MHVSAGITHSRVARLGRAFAHRLMLLAALLSAALPAVAQQQAMQAEQKPAGEKPRPRVAVLEFERIGLNDAEGAAITDRLRTDLVNLRQFVVLDRAQTEQVLKELAFQQQGITDAQQAVRIGKLLNVEYIVTGRVSRLTGAYQVNAQMIRVETAEVVRSETVLHRGDIIGLLSQSMGNIAASLAQLEGGPRPPPVAAPQPAPAPYVAPAPATAEPEPVVQRSSRGQWALVLGGILLAVGGALEIGAAASSADAAVQAEEARTNRDPVAYDTAKTQQEDAESLQSGALGLAGLGVVFLIVYSVISSGDSSSAQNRPAAAPPVQLALQPDGGLSVGYALRW